ERPWVYSSTGFVDLAPWRFAVPCATTLLSCIVLVYLLFSPWGLAGQPGFPAAVLAIALVVVNAIAWGLTLRRALTRSTS
ncbi:MAG: solute:sodium symporter family transporter, partial [Myxococcota bacterium]